MTFLRSIGAPMLENRCLRVALGLACWPRPLRLTPRATDRGTLEPAGEEVTGQIGDLIAGAFEQEVPAVEEMDLRVDGVVGERLGARWAEDLVAAPPHHQNRDPATAQVVVQGRIQRRIGRVVTEQR